MKPFNLLILCLLIHFFPLFAHAQNASKTNAASIKLKLSKLDRLGSVLYFAAHPDDENTSLIAWLANEKLYRTAYLALTRGDGGQNLIGTEQAEELGLIRTQELLAARKDDGGEQFFSTANDFGFSKTFDETFKIWDKEKILANAVWVIRNFQPDVIITRFPGDPRAGHGHHQASSLIAQEAFKAAADPNRFPEQLRYVKPWQAKRILWNTFNFGSANTIRKDQFHVDISQYNPLLGRTYNELAAISRTNHKSQGFGSSPKRGETYEYFETLGGTAPKSSLMDGVNTSWTRIPHAEKVQQLIHQINTDFEITHPERSVPSLVNLLTEIEKLGDAYWPKQKAKEVKELLLACAGIWIASDATLPKYALGESITVTTQVAVQLPGVPIQLSALTVNGEKNSLRSPITLSNGHVEQVQSTFVAKQLTQPYWLKKPHGLGSFTVDDQQLIGLPEAPDLPQVTVSFYIAGKNIDYQIPIQYRYTDPVRGEVKNPVVIAPALTVNLQQKAFIFNGNTPKQLELLFASNAEQVHAKVRPLLPKGWRAEPNQFEVKLAHRNDEMSKVLTIYPGEQAGNQDSLRFEITYADQKQETAYALHEIRHEHIPQITWFPLAAAKLSKIETATSAKRIGYLAGAGDLVAQSLRELGLTVDNLTENDIIHRDLSVYDAIITGIRIYNVNERMRFIQPKLWAYVENGGTLVEQYNVSNGLKVSQIGPYPFTLSRDRVTNEDAPVVFKDSKNQVLNYPNKITEADFEGWIQERGLYFTSDADPRYQQPLQMNDANEDPSTGSLLVAKYGKGKYVYTSLAFFRELPAGVPGAYRLFVNLLAKEQ